METPQPVQEAPANRNRTLWIIAGAALIVCCVCGVLAVAGSYGFFSIRSVETQLFPTEVFPPVITQEVVPTFESDLPSVPPGADVGIGEPPTGGLGNEILRNDTWHVVAFSAIDQGCDQPVGVDSTIEVLQEPDAAGVWLEKWTVACRSGDTHAFEVEYILDATGATFNIRSLP